jgi:hypothetical protein
MFDAYRVTRDALADNIFFTIYGSPMVQALLGIDAGSTVWSNRA